MSEQIKKSDIIRIDEYTYEIPQSYRVDMRVPARVYVNEQMLEEVCADRSLWQLVNVATLPGIQKYAFAMPDIHQGYGFPIGGVAAMAIAEGGVISPGGIGYDINCGVRLLTADMSEKDLAPYLSSLATCIFNKIPSGVGKGTTLHYTLAQIDAVLSGGAHHMVEIGYGTAEDLVFCEEGGRMNQADPRLVSEHAKKRGSDQIGTLGSGNHFLEIQSVDEVYDEEVAAVFGLRKGMVTIMIHCGSRGLGHQTCTDYIRVMNKKLSEWNYTLPDRELIYAPFHTQEAQDYFGAMAAAANYAWANRHMIGHWVRQAWREIIGESIMIKTMYDVCHNIGKIEKHTINGVEKDVIMHRKGATRAFGPGNDSIPEPYRHVGQPVLIPGTMGTASYVLVGTEESMNVAFGSSCHGAGRKMSRAQAKKQIRGSQLRTQLENRGIVICSDSDPGLAEEAPEVYKDIHDVIDVVEGAGLARKIVSLKPLAVVKGG